MDRFEEAMTDWTEPVELGRQVETVAWAASRNDSKLQEKVSDSGSHAEAVQRC